MYWAVLRRHDRKTTGQSPVDIFDLARPHRCEGIDTGPTLAKQTKGSE
jgi:hypothetical protein